MRRKFLPFLAVFVSLFGVFFSAPAHAQVPSDFHLQITPSPIVKSIKPGVPTDIPLTILNLGPSPETLQVNVRKFSVDNATGQLLFDDTSTPEAAQWVSFSEKSFTIRAGDSHAVTAHFNLPKDTGFSYSFAIVISRTSDPKLNSTGNVLRGSVADLTLINVDKPGATRKLDMIDVTTDQQIYEFLPAKINIRLKNTGNVFVAPVGNIFVSRDSSDKKPLATLDLNTKKGYILPGTERVYTASWDDGFPVFKPSKTDGGGDSTDLFFDWNNLTNFRFGMYTAKVVAVYNDGQRDIPITREVTFWVIPYRTIALIVIILIALGLVYGRLRRRRVDKAVKKVIAKHERITKKS
jgi:hypothetical protein